MREQANNQDRTGRKNDKNRNRIKTRRPQLSWALLEVILRQIDWKGLGLNINGKWLNNLRFADDIVLIGKNQEEIATMLDKLNEEGKISVL